MRLRDDLPEHLELAQNAVADLALLKEALAIESVTGNETPFARHLETQLSGLGLETGRGEFRDGRENVWGTRHGDGPNLMILELASRGPYVL